MGFPRTTGSRLGVLVELLPILRHFRMKSRTNWLQRRLSCARESTSFSQRWKCYKEPLTRRRTFLNWRLTLSPSKGPYKNWISKFKRVSMDLRRIGLRPLEAPQTQEIVLQPKETSREIKKGLLAKVPALTEFCPLIFVVKRCPRQCLKGPLTTIQSRLWGLPLLGTRRSLSQRILLRSLILSQSNFKFSLNHQIFQWKCRKAKNMKNWRSN